MQLSLSTVRAVARLLHETDLSEIELESNAVDFAALEAGEPEAATWQLAVRRGAIVTGAAAPRIAPPRHSAPADAETVAPNALAAKTIEVTAPAVGLFRAGELPLAVGAVVKAGQVVAIVESLKIPNEVLAPAAGTIARIAVEIDQGVEYGQIMLVLTPLETSP